MERGVARDERWIAATSRGTLAAVAIGALLLASSASAVSIALDGPAGPVGAGSPLSIQIVITGLGDGTAPTLSSFDLAVSYDAGVLGFTGASFGDGLGQLGVDPVFTQSGVLGGPTRVVVSEASLLPTAVLDAIQPADFVLVTLGFDALAPGESPLAFVDAVLADASNTPGGNQIFPDALIGTNLVVVPVPEPAPVALVVAGLGLLGLRRVTRRRRSELLARRA